MKALGIGQYVMYSEIDVEDTDSDLYDEGGDEESDLDGFIVSDSETYQVWEKVLEHTDLLEPYFKHHFTQ